MTMKREQFLKILEEVKKDPNLNENNIIDKIRKELQSNAEYLDVYLKWANSNKGAYNIDHLFELERFENHRPIKYTLLHLAIKNGHINIVNALLAKNADVHLKDYQNNTSIYLAMENGHANIVNALADRGADVSEKDYSGFTLLHFAAINGRKDVVEALLAKGADPLSKNKNGGTPRDFAEDEDIKQLLKAAEKPFLEKQQAIIKGVAFGSATALLAIVLFATGVVPVGTVPILAAVCMIALVAGITYLVSKPNNAMEVKDDPTQLRTRGSGVTV